MDFRFFGYEGVRDLAGRFRTLSASGFYDDALQFIVANQAERARIRLRDATPRRRGVTAESWKVGQITKSRVRVYTTEGKTVDDLIHGTQGPISPATKNLLQWRDTRPGRQGIYFRKAQVSGQPPNTHLANTVYEVQHEAFATQVVAGQISDATRRARL